MTSPPPPKRMRIAAAAATKHPTISPPPLKRKRLNEPSTSTSTVNIRQQTNHSKGQISEHENQSGSHDDDGATKTKKRQLNIISWNVNGIEHLLPASESQKQKSIKQFFRTRSPQGDSEADSESGVKKKKNDGNLLREFLKRRNWPGIVALQEVKLPSEKSAKERIMEQVRRAVNSPLSDTAQGEDGDESDGDGAEDGELETKKKKRYLYDVHFSLPRDKHNARGLHGRGRVHGVCTLIRRDIAALYGSSSSSSRETRDMDWDLEGRVLLTPLSLTLTPVTKNGNKNNNKNNNENDYEIGNENVVKKMVLINAYFPNGTSYPYHDPLTGHIAGTRHTFKRSFHTLLLSSIQSWEREGFAIVLIGDMNIAPSEIDGYPRIRMGKEHLLNRADFCWKFLDATNKLGMRGVDSWRWCKGEERKYTYHGEDVEDWGSSCDRVDLGVVSREFVEEDDGRGVKLVDVMIWESVMERGTSDHVPIGVVIEFDECVEGQAQSR